MNSYVERARPALSLVDIANAQSETIWYIVPQALGFLLREVAAKVGVPVTGVISDGQHSIRKAVAEVFGIRLSGFIAWLMWRGLYLFREPTFARKSRLFREWNWAMFCPPDISHLGYRRPQRKTSPAPVAVAAIAVTNQR
mgnify:CR=1 FL=1